MNQTDPNNAAKQFEMISPVLEMIYVMVKNMQKYLKVYAEDIGAANLSEYQKTYEALDKVKAALDEVYHITDKAPKAKAQEDQVVMNEKPAAPAMEMPTVPEPAPAPEPMMPMVKEEPMAEVPAAPATPVAAQSTDASASGDSDRVNKILEELRALQSGGAAAPATE